MSSLSLNWDDFRTLLARYLAVDPERIRPDSRLNEDLGLDALDLVLLSVRIEELSDLELPIAAIARVQTIADFLGAFQPMHPSSGAHDVKSDSWRTIRAVRPRDRLRSAG